ncbi:anti-anti-sigma factor [Mycolicibacterium duvalii]|uniref:STAS domain-containing protein n=1 Tax=Mycolicibacterium duvalii TaxID=39688 RepID=UPI000BEF06BD|nr:STAS domain-containing protein [Mycolicibacterium duvalii]MCV7369106.1 STAS domain-containing protein [Mycolicibacterium duvalii]PEG44236.1 anti-anti-sigma factor [Mycolicibacterium duvalii]
MSLSESLPPPSTQRVFRPDPTSFALREEHHRATFSVSELPQSTIRVTVHGEIDATNAIPLARYVEKRLGAARALALDLQTVEFFGASGFAALTNINVACDRAGVRWTLLAGAHVQRLLRICDPLNELPVAVPVAKYSRTGPGDRKLLVGGDH